MAENKPSAMGKRLGVVLGIALLAWFVGMGVWMAMPGSVQRADDYFYDVYYRMRPATDMHEGEVVLVAADEAAATAVDEKLKFGWPWPREFWGRIAKYAESGGAKAVVYDITFKDTSVYQGSSGDDDAFAALMNGMKVPVVFGSLARPNGAWEKFAPAVKEPVFGAVNVTDDKVVRRYLPWAEGSPSLAARVAEAVGVKAEGREPFLLHYYGPHEGQAGKQTFRYVNAYSVLAAQVMQEQGKAPELPAEMFKGKIVVMCAVGVGMYDIKSSPLSAKYPGPEVQATAIENLIRGERVRPVAAWVVALVSLVLAAGVSAGVVVPHGAGWKALAPVAGVVAAIGAGVGLFLGGTIQWMSPVVPLLAMAVATPLAFAWTYLAEDRQRRFMLKALSKVVSPEVAEQLARDPGRLTLGTNKMEITLLFTDLANFTELSEGMDVQQLGEFMNKYLGVMSDQVLAQDGTLDKYIGDAIMCFWNAPVTQEDHAARACRAALAMVAREAAFVAEMGVNPKRVFTRIGINTAGAAVGFVGSSHLFNYTALGDGVNLASRLEGANKLYGTRIILSEHTAKLVRERFWVRRLDVLRVKGKQEPMGVYELRGEKGEGKDEERHAGVIGLYEGAFEAYRRRAWGEAERLLLELSERFGEDGAAAALLDRVREYRAHEPDASWDGVYVSKTK